MLTALTSRFQELLQPHGKSGSPAGGGLCLVGDRRWVPQILYTSPLLFGIDFGETWGNVEIACVIVNELGDVLGLVGPDGLPQVDGISLDVVAGRMMFSFCLAKLNQRVRGVFFIALSGDSQNPLNPNTPGVSLPPYVPGTGLGYLAHVDLKDPSRVGPVVCCTRFNLPVERPGAAMILFGLYSGIDRNQPFHLEAVGTPMALDSNLDNNLAYSTSLALQPTFTQLAQRTAQLFSDPKGDLDDLPVTREDLSKDTMVALRTLQEPKRALAAATRVADELCGVAERERNKCTDMEQLLCETQEALKDAVSVMRGMHYDLEAWRRQALLQARAGDPEQVVAMLQRLPLGPAIQPVEPEPPPPRLPRGPRYPRNHLPEPGMIEEEEYEEDEWEEEACDIIYEEPISTELGTKVDTTREEISYGGSSSSVTPRGAYPTMSYLTPRGTGPRMHNPIRNRPPAATVGDAPLPEMYGEETQDWKPLRNLFFKGMANPPPTGTEGAEPQGAANNGSRHGDASPRGGGPPGASPIPPNADHEVPLLPYEHSDTEVDGAPGGGGEPAATSRDRLAHLRLDKGRLERELAAKEQAHGSSHPEVVAVLKELARCNSSLGDIPKMREQLERVLLVEEFTHGPEDVHLASTLSSLGAAHGLQGNPKQRVDLLRRAMKLEEAAYGRDSPKLALTKARLSVDIDRRMTPQECIQQVEEGVRALEQQLGPEHPEVAEMLMQLGRAHEQNNNHKGHRECLERAIGIQELIYGPDSLMIVSALTSLSEILANLSCWDEHRSILERMLRIKEREYGPDHPKVAITLANLGTAHRRLREPVRARELYERALRIKELHYGAEHAQTALTLANLGAIHGELGDTQRQRELVERALAIFEAAHGPDHPHTQLARKMLESVKPR